MNLFYNRTQIDQCVFTLPVIIKPSSIAGNNDMMGLFSDIILMEVRTLHRFSLHTGGALFFLLITQTHKHKLVRFSLKLLFKIVFKMLMDQLS